MVAVGEDLVLEGEEGAARIDEVDARQMVLLGHLLRAQVLLHGEREVRAALHRRVVRDDHARAALDDPDARHDSGRRRLALVDVPRRKRVQLEERRAGVDEPVDPLPCGELAAGAMPLEGFRAAARRNDCRALAKLRHELLHERLAARERIVAGDAGGEHGHAVSSVRSTAPVVT